MVVRAVNIHHKSVAVKGVRELQLALLLGTTVVCVTEDEGFDAEYDEMRLAAWNKHRFAVLRKQKRCAMPNMRLTEITKTALDYKLDHAATHNIN